MRAKLSESVKTASKNLDLLVVLALEGIMDINLQAKIESIRQVVFDFDGVFTDNHVWVSEEGKEWVACSRGDGYGMRLLKNLDVGLLVLSTETNPVVRMRCEKLGLSCISGSENKLKALGEYLEERKISWEETVFVGNDVNDLACLSQAGLSVGVSDSHPLVLQKVNWVLNAPGGYGAIREFCEVFYACKKNLDLENVWSHFFETVKS